MSSSSLSLHYIHPHHSPVTYQSVLHCPVLVLHTISDKRLYRTLPTFVKLALLNA